MKTLLHTPDSTGRRVGDCLVEKGRHCRTRTRVCLVTAFVLLALTVGSARSDTYYVDSKDGDDSNFGTSEEVPWKTLSRVNREVFRAGDEILLKRGATWTGTLSPKGSGQTERPIRIAAYGTGPLPVIDGGEGEAAIRLFNQEHWEIRDVETIGGNPYGIFISGDEGTLHHLHIRNVVVHDVGGTVKSKNSGLIVVVSGGPKQTFEDVLIDGATAYRTTQWAGIIVNGASAGGESMRASNVVVRNCLVHDVFGDGIVLFQVRDGVIEKSVAWNTGMQPTESIGTPNAIWTWSCDHCVVQLNEGYFSDSPGVDGGVFDIDWGNNNNIVQYNYGHDAQGYCVSVFGAGQLVTTNSVVRYNVCVNNGRSPRLAERQGDIFVSTWDGGSLDGLQIYNNTVYWNPPTDAPIVRLDASFTGDGPNLIANNVMYSTVPTLISARQPIPMENNLYWYSGVGDPVWEYDGQVFRSIDAFRSSTGREKSGMFADPKLELFEPARIPLRGPVLSLGAASPGRDRGIDVGYMERRDILGKQVPQGKGLDIGAFEYEENSPANGQDENLGEAPDFELRTPEGRIHRLAASSGTWRIVSFLNADPHHGASNDSQSQMVVLQSMLHQYRTRGLKVLVVVPKPPEVSEDHFLNLRDSWEFGRTDLLLDPGDLVATRYGVDLRPTTFLLDGADRIIARWNGFAPSVQVGLTLRSLLGPPPGAVSAEGMRELHGRTPETEAVGALLPR